MSATFHPWANGCNSGFQLTLSTKTKDWQLHVPGGRSPGLEYQKLWLWIKCDQIIKSPRETKGLAIIDTNKPFNIFNLFHSSRLIHHNPSICAFSGSLMSAGNWTDASWTALQVHALQLARSGLRLGRHTLSWHWLCVRLEKMCYV